MAELREGRLGTEVHTGLPSAGVLCWEEESPRHLAVKSSEIFVSPKEMGGGCRPRRPLKGPAQGLTRLHTLTWAPEEEGRQLGGAGDVQGDSELCGFGARAGGTGKHYLCVEPASGATCWEGAIF